jgi:hypothetical protein
MLLIIGVLIVIGFITVVIFLLSLFFGGEDPYERELAELDRHDELLDALHDRCLSNNSLNIVDARSIHLHNHTYNEKETEKFGMNLDDRNRKIREAQSSIDRNSKEE